MTEADEHEEYRRIGAEVARMLAERMTAGPWPIAISDADHEMLGRIALAGVVGAGWSARSPAGFTAQRREPLCKVCGGRTMHVGDVCYGCAQAVPR